MKVVKIDSGLPIKMWLNDVEDAALNQAYNLSKLPFAFHHVSLMPDSHSGYGMPIGGVIATEKVVIPNAVGVDIGCGVIAFKIKVKASDISREDLVKIVDLVKAKVPVGFSRRSKNDYAHIQLPMAFYDNSLEVLPVNLDNAFESLGTLGGGNHFIEVQKDSDDNVWVMIHSGSRNLGKKVAEYYDSKARDMNARFFSQVLPEWELAFLPLSTIEGRNYVKEMNGCVEYAYINRQEMMFDVLECFADVLAHDIDILERYNIHHNYAAFENHFGKNVFIHRKGATSAKVGEIGLIPGSQGTASYIVKGLGNPESFCSCSHGAGRAMSRSKAKKELDLEKEAAILDNQGIIHSMTSIDSLDEAPGAYKDIECVMENQKDLVSIVEKLIPLAVIKG
jgi:tRNA-splicing ligase RtcB (3'-phosphate/5'-hydroxy nucleic acid ligase)